MTPNSNCKPLRRILTYIDILWRMRCKCTLYILVNCKLLITEAGRGRQRVLKIFAFVKGISKNTSGHTSLNDFSILYWTKWYTKLPRFLSFKATGCLISKIPIKTMIIDNLPKTQFLHSVPFEKTKFGIFTWNALLFLRSRSLKWPSNYTKVK